jgi:glutathione synthase/RimK-type ligase-like ATP-grasp enzyme
VCFPSSAEAELYDDKLLQGELLQEFGLPAIPSFISYSAEQALEHAAACTYPAVWKIGCGAGSLGVELVRHRRQAERRIRKVFSFTGRGTYWPYLGQKNYVCLQPLMANAGYDLRAIVVGDAVRGYYRTPPRGEFRASGMRRWHYAALPPAAMRLARRVRDRFDLTMVGLDMLADPSETRLAIIEMSLFPQLSDDWDLVVDGRPGSYRFRGDEGEFVEERHATHDRLLAEVLTRRWIAPHLLCSTGAGAA